MEARASCPAAAPSVEGQFRVLVGVTGSVAALKLPLLVRRLLDIPGICDNLLTCVIRAWDCSKPLLFCPAMNTACGTQGLRYVEIPCVAKKLVCGDQHLGAMAAVGTIVDRVKEILPLHSGFQQS
uniref:Phosphopantothenoylcysteine decarboxylase n=1 Tax=Equus caballus TaxID=9796 RepID=A0A9L0R849_HORSE